MGVGGKLHAPAALPPRKETRYPFYSLRGPQGVENFAVTAIRSPDRPAVQRIATPTAMRAEFRVFCFKMY